MGEQKKRKLDHVWVKRAIALAFIDALSVLAAYLAALFLRFDFIFSAIPREYLDGYVWSMPYWVIITIVVFYGFRLYHSIWRFAGMAEFKAMKSTSVLMTFTFPMA